MIKHPDGEGENTAFKRWDNSAGRGKKGELLMPYPFKESGEKLGRKRQAFKVLIQRG